MGAGFLNYDPSAGEAPPQAPAPVGTLADLAVTPAPSSTDVTRTAAFGDTGAAQYNRLLAAGQRQASPGLAGLAGMSPAASPAQPTSAGVQPSDFMQLFGDIAAGAAGHPEAGQERALAQARMQQQQQSMELQKQQAMQSQATSDFSFLKDLKNMAPQYRPGLITNYFARQGRQVPPEMAAMIGDEQILSRLTDPETEARLAHDPAFKQMFWYAMDKPEAFVKFNTGIMQDKAQTDRYIADAEKARTEADAAPGKVEADRQKNVLAIAKDIQQLQRGPTDAERRMLDIDGKVAILTPLNGVEGAQTWRVVPKSYLPQGAAGTDYVTEANKREAARTGEKQKAKEAATTTSATRLMREKAPKVVELTNEVEKALDKIKTGPFKSRMQDVLAGKIGAENPDFIAFKDNATLLGSLLMNMHVGQRGGEYIGKKFDDMIGASFQSEANMRQTMRVIRRYADIVEHAKEGDEVGLPTEATGTPAPGGEVSAEDFLNQ